MKFVTEQSLLVACTFVGVCQLGILVLLGGAILTRRTPKAISAPILYTIAASVSVLVGRQLEVAILLFVCAILISQIFSRKCDLFLPAWHIFMTNMIIGLIVGLISMQYTALMLADLPRTPGVIEAGLLLAVPWGLMGFSSTAISATLQFIDYFRKVRNRPVTPLDVDEARRQAFYPRVSLHVPCYAEPPEVVIATLDSLSRLDYPNFEVLLVDNNTMDPALWRPVEKHCQKLGERFRFIHVEGLKGAKGGALNYACKLTDPDAEIVGVFDSDFICEPDYLLSLIGFFRDPNMAFVQTPHDYRDFEDSLFRRSCYWEYRDKHTLVYPGMNEWDASPITGTMCLIRRSALEAAGGWSEKCLSEDSDLSLTLAAAGYAGQYVSTTFGRGIVPETFYEYRRQRFRWVAGTTQQISLHWRFFLSRAAWGSARLSRTRYLLLLFYRLGLLSGILSYSLLLLGTVMAYDCLRHHSTITLPTGFVLLVISSFLSRVGFAAIRNRLMGRSLIDAFRSLVADAAVTHIRVVAAFQGVCFGRSLAWLRTSKFKAVPESMLALRSVIFELILGVLAWYLAFRIGINAQWKHPDILSMLSVGLLAAGYSWLCAPLIALIAEIEVRRSSAARKAGPGMTDAVNSRIPSAPVEPVFVGELLE